MKDYTTLASKETINLTKKSLEERGFEVIVVQTGAEAKAAALQLLQKGSDVFTATSVTLDQTGISSAINESGDYNAIKNKLYDPHLSAQDKKAVVRAAAAPDAVVGSVHAITKQGEVLVASATGSQLPAYAYGAQKVVWVASTAKIVDDLADAHQRLLQHIFPLEDVRALKAYGIHSSINKTMVFSREGVKNRITLILVEEQLGY